MTDGKPARREFDRSIVEGALPSAVWKLAWPTMLQNIIGGLQGIVDQAMVGQYVGHTGNAAIGVSLQLFILVIVFVASVFTGMGVLVARFAGAGDAEKVNRTVYQAFLCAVFMAVGVLAPLGYFLAPTLLNLVNAAPEVQVEALPYIRIMFVFSIGMLMFFMMSRRPAVGRRRAHAVAARRDDDRPQHRPERHPDPWARTDSRVRDGGRGDGYRDRERLHRRGVPGAALLRQAGHPLLALDVVPAGPAADPRALPLRVASRLPGDS